MNRASGSLLGWSALLVVVVCCGLGLIGTFPEVGDRLGIGLGHDLHSATLRIATAIATLVLAVVCGFITATAVPALVEQWSLLLGGVTVPATVIAVEEKDTESGSTEYWATVDANRTDGGPTRLRAEAWPGLAPGTATQVRYHPKGRTPPKVWAPGRPATVVGTVIGNVLSYGFLIAGTVATVAFAYLAFAAIFLGF